MAEEEGERSEKFFEAYFLNNFNNLVKQNFILNNIFVVSVHSLSYFTRWI